MNMKRLLWVCMMIAVVAVTGCSSDNGGSRLLIGDNPATQQDINDLVDDLDTANTDLNAVRTELFGMASDQTIDEITTAIRAGDAAGTTLTNVVTELNAGGANLGTEPTETDITTAIMGLNAESTTLTAVVTELNKDPALNLDPADRTAITAQITALYDDKNALNRVRSELNMPAASRDAIITAVQNLVTDDTSTVELDPVAVKKEMAIANDTDRPGTGTDETFAVTGGAVGTAPTMTIGTDSLGVIVDEDDATEFMSMPDTADTAVGNFTRKVYTRTVARANDTVTVLDSIEAAGNVEYATFYSTADRPGVDGMAVTTAGATLGQLAIKEDDVAINADLFDSANFPTNPEAGSTADSIIEYEDDARMFAGMFNDVEGTYSCTDTTCSATSDENGLKALDGDWFFTPDQNADGEITATIAGEDYDADYLAFGYWLRTAGTGDDMTYSVGALATGSLPFDNDTDATNDNAAMASLTGTANYRGPAAGIYVMKTDLNNDNMGPVPTGSGEFMAKTSLTANFDMNDISGYTISGMVTDFKDGDNPIDPSWALNLDSAPFSDREYSSDTWTFSAHKNTFSGATTGGENTEPGTWSGTFYGSGADTDTVTAGVQAADPTGVAGDFTGNFATGTVLGAFGAEKNP